MIEYILISRGVENGLSRNSHKVEKWVRVPPPQKNSAGVAQWLEQSFHKREVCRFESDHRHKILKKIVKFYAGVA